MTFAAIACGALLSSVSADAAFPGQNGVIVYAYGSTIWTVVADGTGNRPLIGPSGTVRPWAFPTWSADGTKIAFEGYDASGNQALFVADSSGGGASRLAAADFGPLSWSPDGRRIAFSRPANGETGETHVFTVGADGSNLVDLTAREGFSDDTPAWSPDGKHIAYTNYYTPHSQFRPYEIEMMRPDGSGRTVIAANPLAHLYGPSWSPDGTKVVFSAFGEDRWALMASTLSGSSSIGLPVALTNDYKAEYPHFSPDGSRLVFGDGLTGQILVANADGTGEAPIATGFTPDWQPIPPPPTPPTPPPVYVALGDSVAAGEGLQDTSTPQYLNPCDQADSAYPSVLAKIASLGPQQRFREVYPGRALACTGATTWNVLNQVQPVNGQDVNPQLASARRLHPQIVTITVGVDDLNWGAVVIDCLLPGADGCTSHGDAVENMLATVVKPNLGRILDRLASISPKPTILVTGYYDPFPLAADVWNCSGGWGLLFAGAYADGGIALLRAWEEDLNTTLEATANTHGAKFIDLATPFAGHGMCSTHGTWVNPLKLKTLTGDLSAFHPNRRGQTEIAKAILKHM